MKHMMWSTSRDAAERETRQVMVTAAAASVAADRGVETESSLRYTPEPAASRLSAGGRTYGRGCLAGGGSIIACDASIAGPAWGAAREVGMHRHSSAAASAPVAKARGCILGGCCWRELVALEKKNAAVCYERRACTTHTSKL